MKCVIVVFALLCSAQALKMDKPHRKLTLDETTDRTDKALGRPLRSQMTLEQRRNPYNKAAKEKDSAEAVGDGLADFMADNGGADSLTTCHTTHTTKAGVCQCAGEELANTAGLNTAFCGYINMYITSATYIMDQIAQIAIDETDMAADVFGVFDSSKTEDKAYSASVSILSNAAEYWDLLGSDDDCQSDIDNCEYCDYIIGNVMAFTFMMGGGANRYSLTGDHMAKIYKAAEDIAHKDFGGYGEGSMGDNLYSDYQNAKNEVGPHKKLHIVSYGAYKQSRKNWRLAKAGKFNIGGHSPQ